MLCFVSFESSLECFLALTLYKTSFRTAKYLTLLFIKHWPLTGKCKSWPGCSHDYGCGGNLKCCRKGCKSVCTAPGEILSLLIFLMQTCI
uniref:WAP domain-containing protein n=1 Tax=Salarias fasciatus TaxID=181472 RepID=A0A672FX42_SALFA